MQQTAQHTYWKNCTDGKWFVRSKSCQKKMPQPTDGAPPACSECVKLAEPKKVQRVVQRFSAKYNAARLLQKRLFGTPDEVQELLTEIKKSTFGIRCGQYWKKLVALTNQSLQTFVRATLGSTPPALQNTAMRHLLSNVVAPCMKVNVAAVHGNLHRLTAQFVTALANQQMTEAWI